MKNQRKKQILLILGILVLVLILYLAQQNNENSITINRKRVVVEIADSPSERQQGLMFRTSLPENQGMLFIFEQPDPVAFWMKNTLIPLDIIFIDESKRVTDIQTAQPCTADPCPLYEPPEPVLYVLELNAGYAEKNDIKVGDKVEISIRN